MQPSLFTPSDVPSPMGVADAATVATNRFSLPIHSDELGRLPLHGLTMSVTNADVTDASPGPPALEHSRFDSDAGLSGLLTMAALPPTPAELPSPSAEMAGGLDAAGLMGIDGGLDAPRQVYESLFANMPAQDFSSVMGDTNTPSQSSGQVLGAQGQGFADAENTLEMWSSAPSDFQ